MAISFRFLQHASKALALGGAGLGAGAIYRFQQVEREQFDLPRDELWSFKTKEPSSSDKKKVIVIGGGVVGITAAYKLALKGHSVALLEPRGEPGKECSACAAGGMQRSNPVVDRDSWVAVTKSFLSFARLLFGDAEKPYRFFHIDWLSTVTDPFFLRWSATFTNVSLFPCSEQQRLQKEMLSFTKYAVQDMVDMMQNESDPMAKKSGYNPSGSLSLSYDSPRDEDPNAAKAKAENPTRGNTLEPSKQLDGTNISLQEPSVLHQKRQPSTAKFEYESCAASSERFTEELAERCAKNPKLDVTFFYNTRVKGVSTGPSGGRKCTVTQLHTNRGVIVVPEGAQVLVAVGAWTPHVMALMDLYAPVYPLKGYAMSVSAKKVLSSKALEPRDLPTRIVCDKYMYTSRLGDEIRITSIGEFSGWSTRPTPDVEKEFRREAIRQFPQLESYIKEAKVKCGHRPYVSDGILLLGRIDTFDNLLISCGPGSNGWKLAMGSGDIAERLVSGKTEDEISDELGFDVHSFSPAGRVIPSPIFTKICRARWGVEQAGEKDAISGDSS
mmetsp:Transcript_22149/g.47613  ORF Transcript_22149/g.47613 Transcript_22149/m.47613 type:complete len:555 (+) Transcript_22149:138-1802(+)|eukprot:CAMPEP_0172534692 /NCGR_PEP_ID=MMETSP1067-20121228/6961_1 /TAXON_ID=265564 ORGANISM="Thalassiosira punctigera, Strain Tpunct2005C2" /NCGR_SAMPLE_ID=MMETSP1067 /ASSEMBLY_ACC=CAM_ASM_000444 /LENGTH=554 /DNA_ID=CAMNT_0013319509 /DNA_START=119 /DNA_END=1783 /DNA_ORIENTATION=+